MATTKRTTRKPSTKNSIKRTPSKAKRLVRAPRFSWQTIAIAALVLAIIGALFVLFSRASSGSGEVETWSQNPAGAAGIFSDSSASGGGYIRFGQLAYKDIFVSPTGNDSSAGTSPSQPVKTINKAVSLASGYARIRLMTGTYTEQILIKKSNLIIEPYGDGDVTINGAIPEFISGVKWTNVQAGIYKYNLGRDEFNSDGSNTIYDANGKQQWTYPDLNQFLSRSTVNKLPGVFINNFLLDQAVYVATDTGQAPTAPLYIGGADPTIYIKGASNVSINSAGSSRLKLVYGSYNVQIRDSDNIRVSNVDITGGRSAVAAFDSSNIVIQNNQLHGTFGRDWVWKDVKERSGTKAMENQAIQIKALTKDISNIVVDGNDMSGYFNGVGFTNLSSFFTVDSSISNNRIHDSLDDGIEIDSQYKNLVIHGNKVYDVYSPFSSTGGAVGPVDVYENVFVANRTISYGAGGETSGPSFALKMNNDQGDLDKNLHFYYNTFYFAGSGVGPNGIGGGNGRRTVDTTASRVTKNVSFINNIFYSYDGGILRGTGRAQDGVEWDGNLFYSEKNYPSNPWADNYWSWNTYYTPDNDSTYESLSDIISAGAMPSQWQGNAEGNPSFSCVDITNSSCFKPTAGITKPAARQPIPSGFTDSARLNARTRLGALE